MSIGNYSAKYKFPYRDRAIRVRDHIKSGRLPLINSALDFLDTASPKILEDFFSNDRVLIPVPRSSLLQSDSMWPGRVISSELINRGYGGHTANYLQRIKAVRKASLQASADERPMVTEHMESIGINGIITESKVTLIDDIVTQGRTSYACAKKLSEAFPHIKDIKLFTILRTVREPEDHPEFRAISRGYISYNPGTDKTWRHD